MSSNADSVLQLGRELADALNPSDVIGRWMSHHLAELITRCEENPEDEELATTTRDVVLKLWEHKSGAPFQADPYRYLQPLLRAISRLEPNPDPWAFYSPFDGETPSVESISTYPLLRAALDIDQEIGTLIRLCVGIAAQEALSCEDPWVIAGKEIAITEEDRAVNALERIFHRMRLNKTANSSDVPSVQNVMDSDLDLMSLAEPATAAQLPGEPVTPDPHGTGTEETFESIGPLALSLQSAIIRCRRLLDQLSDHYVNATNEGGSTQINVVDFED